MILIWHFVIMNAIIQALRTAPSNHITLFISANITSLKLLMALIWAKSIILIHINLMKYFILNS